MRDFDHKAFRQPPPYPALAGARSAPTVAPQLKVHLKNLGDELRFGFGALGTAELNNLEGNQWFGCDLATSNFVASGILVFDADAVTVNENHVTGNSDVGLFVVFADGGLYEKNHLDDEGADAVTTCPYDFGIWDFPGTGNTFNKNHVSGFDTPFDPDPLPGSKNKAL